MATWNENPDLMERLRKVQGHKLFRHQDIISFAGMCDNRTELLRHVENCERQTGMQQMSTAKGFAISFYVKAGRADLVKTITETWA